MGPAGAATLDKRRPDIRDELGYIAPPNRKLPPVPGSNYNTCDRVKRGTVISKCGERFDQIAFSDFFDRSLMKILSLSKYNVIREVFCVVLDVPFYNYCKTIHLVVSQKLFKSFQNVVITHINNSFIIQCHHTTVHNSCYLVSF